MATVVIKFADLAYIYHKLYQLYYHYNIQNPRRHQYIAQPILNAQHCSPSPGSKSTCRTTTRSTFCLRKSSSSCAWSSPTPTYPPCWGRTARRPPPPTSRSYRPAQRTCRTLPRYTRRAPPTHPPPGPLWVHASKHAPTPQCHCTIGLVFPAHNIDPCKPWRF